MTAIKPYPYYKHSGVDWLNNIPAEWKVSKVKELFLFKKIRAKKENPVILSLTSKGIIIRDISTNEGQIAESYYNYHIVNIGDLLLNPMDLVTNAFASVSNVEGVISPAYFNLQIAYGHSSKFYEYYFKTQYWNKTFFAHGKGVSHEHRWTLNAETLINYPIPLPKPSEQTNIVKFLDFECNKIDILIEKSKKMMALLDKKRQAVITHYVTKGIKPTSLKTSGIDWLGDIPKHWELKRSKFIFQIKKRIAGKEGYDVLSITQKGIKIKDIVSGDGQLSSDYSKYQIVEIGDFAMNHMDLLTGYVDISKSFGVTSPDYRVFSLIDKNSLSEYFLNILRICYKNKIFYPLGQGAANFGRWRLPTDNFYNFILPLPPLEEQIQIVEYIKLQIANIDKLEASLNKQIELLKERKTSLITAAVTGKIDVRDYNKQQEAA